MWGYSELVKQVTHFNPDLLDSNLDRELAGIPAVFCFCNLPLILSYTVNPKGRRTQACKLGPIIKPQALGLWKLSSSPFLDFASALAPCELVSLS